MSDTKTDRKKIRVINTFKENLAILVNLQAKLIRTGRLTLTHFNLFHFISFQIFIQHGNNNHSIMAHFHMDFVAPPSQAGFHNDR